MRDPQRKNCGVRGGLGRKACRAGGPRRRVACVSAGGRTAGKGRQRAAAQDNLRRRCSLGVHKPINLHSSKTVRDLSTPVHTAKHFAVWRRADASHPQLERNTGDETLMVPEERYSRGIIGPPCSALLSPCTLVLLFISIYFIFPEDSMPTLFSSPVTSHWAVTVLSTPFTCGWVQLSARRAIECQKSSLWAAAGLCAAASRGKQAGVWCSQPSGRRRSLKPRACWRAAEGRGCCATFAHARSPGAPQSQPSLFMRLHLSFSPLPLPQRHCCWQRVPSCGSLAVSQHPATLPFPPQARKGNNPYLEPDVAVGQKELLKAQPQLCVAAAEREC